MTRIDRLKATCLRSVDYKLPLITFVVKVVAPYCNFAETQIKKPKTKLGLALIVLRAPLSSAEQKQFEEQVIQAISEQIEHWKRTDQWTKLKVIEMIYVKGSGNKQVAELLAISEQKVANYKSDFQMKLRSIIQRMNLEQHVFPELYEMPAPEQWAQSLVKRNQTGRLSRPAMVPVLVAN